MGDEKGQDRRGFLTAVTTAIGVVGVGASIVPFVRAMSPTKDIIAAGMVEVDVSDIKPGELRTILWRKQPIFILRRTPEMIEKAKQNDPTILSDPATPEDRAKDPEWFVSIAICTHLGCIPSWQPEKVPGLEQPGFYCPCHGGKYDTLGRRLDGPPPENLHLIPYGFIKDPADPARLKIKIGTERFAGFVDNIRKIGELPKV